MQNIVFIMADQLRADALGFMKKFPVKTPNIDRLAKTGIVFQNAYCTNPVCAPARASLMTGAYTYDHGVYYNDQNWPSHMDTLPRSLSENCFYTALVGKKHLFPERASIGFDKLVLGSQDVPFLRRVMKQKRHGDPGKWYAAETLQAGYPTEPTTTPIEEYMDVVRTDLALHELDLIGQRRECGPQGDEPFFLKVSLSKPHSPCNPPEPYFSMYKPEDIPPPAATEEELKNFGKQQMKWYEIWSQLDKDRALKHRAQYFGCVTLVDEMVGRVIKKTEEMGIFENTLFVLTSDHGDGLCDHHYQQKAFFYDSMAKVPFIFSGPGIPEGRVVKENVSHIDLYPTLMDYCGLAMPRLRNEAGEFIYPDVSERDSVSLIPYFCDEGEVNPNRVIVSENAMFGQRFMLKQGDTKVNYYINPDAENEFDHFDLKDDPDEMNNMGKSFSLEDMTPEMRCEFDKVMARTQEHQSSHYYFQGKVRPVFT
jgi:arylsulfatase